MISRKIALLVGCVALAASTLAGADDDDGRKLRKKHRRDVHHHHHHYGCPPPPASVPTHPHERLAEAPRFPRESASDAASARQRQRELLLRELATEEQLLERARRDPRDPAAIEQHQRNIDALRRELVNALR